MTNLYFLNRKYYVVLHSWCSTTEVWDLFGSLLSGICHLEIIMFQHHLLRFLRLLAHFFPNLENQDEVGISRFVKSLVLQIVCGEILASKTAPL